MRSRPARSLLALSLLLAGCGTVKSPTEPAPAPGGVPALTFTQIQTQIFTPVCAKAGCHAAGSSPSGLVLEAGQSYGNLVGRPAAENGTLDRVAPGEPGPQLHHPEAARRSEHHGGADAARRPLSHVRSDRGDRGLDPRRRAEQLRRG